MSHPRAIQSSQAPAAIGPYSQALAFDGLLFCSGQLALDLASGELMPGGAAEQTSACLANLQAVCSAAGTSLGRALRLTVYLTDLQSFGEVNDTYAGFFDAAAGPPPARATVGVAALPRGAQVEIDAIVALSPA